MTLQWGRNLFVAESRQVSNPTALTELLQWGRNLFVAESHTLQRDRDQGHVSFNGAATCSLRKEKKGGVFRHVRPSMGPQLVRCGKEAIGDRTLTAAGPSMGPQLVRCGKTGVNIAAIVFIDLQWGRNLFVAESFCSYIPPT